MSLQELETQHAHALSAADAIISAAEREKRPLTTYEQTSIDAKLKEASNLKPKIDAAKAKVKPSIKTSAELRAAFPGLVPDRPAPTPARNFGGVEAILPDRFSRDYYDSFYANLGRTGPISAAMYEGSSPAGGYAVPVKVDQQIVPLAPQDSAVRRIATVIPTKSDVKYAQVTARAVVSAKSETSNFATASQTLGQFTLSAFMAGVEIPVSMEFAQDVTLFNTFTLDDAVSAFLEYEESLFISGSGNGQAQGLIGNVGAGVTDEPDGSGNLVSIQGTLDILGQLKETYHEGASWLMQRATSLIIRKAQISASPALFEPVFRRENGKDLLHGYPVAYSSQMPTAARGATPIIFGDFGKAYVIGDRGGSALFVKALDQASLASQGEINLFFYRRTDGRVRRSEAIQSYTISAS
jgi:HK97 family phage major capsid protein